MDVSMARSHSFVLPALPLLAISLLFDQCSGQSTSTSRGNVNAWNELEHLNHGANEDALPSKAHHGSNNHLSKMNDENEGGTHIEIKESKANGRTLPMLQVLRSPSADIEMNSHGSAANVMSSVRANDTSVVLITYGGLPQDMPICRIKGICRVGDGSYLLPYWMKKYSGHIEKCGIEKAHYVLHEATSELDGTVWAVKGFRPGTMTLTETFAEYDLIGGNTPRGDSHLLVTDLAPSLFVLDLYMRPEYHETMIATSCIQSRNEPCGESLSGSGIRPLVLVDIRVTEQESFLWPKGFIRMISNGLLGSLHMTDLHDLYGWRMRTQAACFNSVLTTRADIKALPSRTFDGSHFLFRSNGLSRESLQKLQSSNKPEDACEVKILILNKYGKRHIIGAETLRLAIESRIKDIKPRPSSIRILSEVVYFENSSFHEQVSIMQESNVVVSALGTSNANIVFLRPDSLFVEVMPFALESDTYANIAKVFRVKYRSVMAQPDREVFESCLVHSNAQLSSELSKFMQQWGAHAERFRTDAFASDLNPLTTFRISENSSAHPELGIKNILECTNFQRLSFNVRDVARVVVDESLSQCGCSPRVGTI